MNNLIKGIGSKLSSVARKAGSKAGAKGVEIAQKGIVAAQRITAVKWSFIIFAIILVVTALGGVTAGVGGVARSMAFPASCVSGGSGNKLISEADKAGVSMNDNQKSEASKVSAKGCGGVGYNGDTYPPTPGRVTGYFGEVADLRNGVPHSGTDIADVCDSPIFAFAGGTVTKVVLGTEAKSTAIGYVYPMGRITIEHTPEFSTSYVHTKGSTTTVKVGDIVSAGDQIATQWSNGRSTGCHLHFEAYMNGKLVDGLAILKEAGYPYEKGYYYALKDFPPKPDGSGGGGAVADAPPGSAKAIAANMMASYGWDQNQFSNCLVPLWTRESSWRVNAMNPAFAPSKPHTPEYQAYGIPQGAPGAKMGSAGADWKTNPATQIKWGLGYIQGRYGSPCGAWQHSEAYNWY